MNDLLVIIPILIAFLAAALPTLSAAIKAESDRDTIETKLFFDAQLKAYTDLLQAIVPDRPLTTEEACTAALKDVITAIQPALLLSREETAATIRRFYFAYCDYVQEWRTGIRTEEVIERHREQLWILQDCLRDEMYSLEISRKQRKKRFHKAGREEHSRGNHN